MNAIFYASKRVFHGALRVTRSSFLSVAPGLTAARFDLMYALTCRSGGDRYRDRFSGQRLRQSDLWRKLGVTPPVVARMLRSLEALGWITRQRPLYGD